MIPTVSIDFECKQRSKLFIIHFASYSDLGSCVTNHWIYAADNLLFCLLDSIEAIFARIYSFIIENLISILWIFIFDDLKDFMPNVRFGFFYIFKHPVHGDVHVGYLSVLILLDYILGTQSFTRIAACTTTTLVLIFKSGLTFVQYAFGVGIAAQIYFDHFFNFRLFLDRCCLMVMLLAF